MATAVPLCQSCQEETKYHCLSCQASVCNRSECSVPAPEETPNWKAGSRVAFCMTCKTGGKNTAAEKPEVNRTKAALTRQDRLKTSKSNLKSHGGTKEKVTEKRKCMSLQQRVELINYAKDHPKEGYRKIADKFGIGRTQAHKILKERKEILASYESQLQSNNQKRVRCGKYSVVNEALRDWYVICRNSNIPVSGTMLQEEALMIAEKMGISGFAASNGWLESFKKQHNLHHMAIAGEDGDVKDETIESWNE